MTDKQLDRIMEAVRKAPAENKEKDNVNQNLQKTTEKESALTEKKATHPGRPLRGRRPAAPQQKAEATGEKEGNTPAEKEKKPAPRPDRRKSAPRRPANREATGGEAARRPDNRMPERQRETDRATQINEGGRKKESVKKGAKAPAASASAIASVASAQVPQAPAARGRGKRGRGNGRPAPDGKLKVMMLGGLQEIGKNITVLEYGEDIIVVDCGMGFPDEDMLGVDLVIPDFTYLEKNAERVRGVLLTHGHEDHIGGVPYLLRMLQPPVYGTRLTIGILQKKLEEFSYKKTPALRTVEAGETVHLGKAFSVEFIHVNHSIADACALAIRTPVGTVIHSGDFKLDVSPIDGKMMDVVRLGEIGNEGVELLLCESTNAERPGFTPSERKVGGSLEQIFSTHTKNRLIIATFSSNVHRVQQIIDTSARHGRHVAVIGRSMVNVIGAALELGYMDLPDGVLIDIGEIKRFKPEEITLITTGSQGEPMSALYRMAFEEHDKVKLTPNDVVVLSASAIPGNEKLVGKIINALVKNGVKVISDNSLSVHVSGHACQEELKLMHALTKPHYFMPIHGEYRHLYAHKELAEFMGMPSDRIFVPEIGKVLELDGKTARFADTVPAGNVLVDGSGVGDVGSVVLRDRKHLAEDGLIVVVATVDGTAMDLLSGPDLVSRGFVYVKESGDMMEEARAVARDAIENSLRHGNVDWMELKTVVKDALSRYFFRKTKRKPMILPVIMQI